MPMPGFTAADTLYASTRRYRSGSARPGSPARITPAVVCNHGDLLPNPEDCGSFFQCVWGEAVLMPCPAGLVFNPNINVCDWPENYHCEDQPE